MILVGQYDSPYVRRVAISLHVLGIPFERNTMSVFADAEAMRKINPLGRIPSLILDDGEILIDSTAILDHLDELAGPERALVPPRGRERRRALYTLALITGALEKTIAVLYETTLRPPEKLHAPWVERCRLQLDTALAALEAIAPDGARIMQPQISLACMLGYFELRYRAPLESHAYPKLEKFYARFRTHDAFVKTMSSADEVMPSAI